MKSLQHKARVYSSKLSILLRLIEERYKNKNRTRIAYKEIAVKIRKVENVCVKNKATTGPIIIITETNILMMLANVWPILAPMIASIKIDT